jgi:hypothetical protein
LRRWRTVIGFSREWARRVERDALASLRSPEIRASSRRSLARESFPLLKADLHHAPQLNET